MENNRIVRLPEVCAIAGLSSSTVYRLERSGSFPQRVRLSTNSVGYRLSEVIAWVQAREPVVTAGEVKRGRQ